MRSLTKTLCFIVREVENSQMPICSGGMSVLTYYKTAEFVKKVASAQFDRKDRGVGVSRLVVKLKGRNPVRLEADVERDFFILLDFIQKCSLLVVDPEMLTPSFGPPPQEQFCHTPSYRSKSKKFSRIAHVFYY